MVNVRNVLWFGSVVILNKINVVKEVAAAPQSQLVQVYSNPNARSSSCVDNPDFLDDSGNPCSWWAGKTCTTAKSAYSHSTAGQQQLLCNCAATCNYSSCTSAPCISRCDVMDRMVWSASGATPSYQSLSNSCTQYKPGTTDPYGLTAKVADHGACVFHAQCSSGYCCSRYRICLPASQSISGSQFTYANYPEHWEQSTGQHYQATQSRQLFQGVCDSGGAGCDSSNLSCSASPTCPSGSNNDNCGWPVPIFKPTLRGCECKTTFQLSVFSNARVPCTNGFTNCMQFGDVWRHLPVTVSFVNLLGPAAEVDGTFYITRTASQPDWPDRWANLLSVGVPGLPGTSFVEIAITGLTNTYNFALGNASWSKKSGNLTFKVLVTSRNQAGITTILNSAEFLTAVTAEGKALLDANVFSGSDFAFTTVSVGSPTATTGPADIGRAANLAGISASDDSDAGAGTEEDDGWADWVIVIIGFGGLLLMGVTVAVVWKTFGANALSRERGYADVASTSSHNS